MEKESIKTIGYDLQGFKEQLTSLMTESAKHLISKEQKYVDWITDYLSKNDPQTQCVQATEMMKKAFPELKRVRGMVFIVPAALNRDHMWLVTPTNEIVDPTASQFGKAYFGHSVIADYLPRDENEVEPSGKCMECGGLCYPPNNNACSEEHAISLNSYYQTSGFEWATPYTKEEAEARGYGPSFDGEFQP